MIDAMNNEQIIISAPYTIRNGRRYIARGTPAVMRARLEAIEKSIALALEVAPTYTGESVLNDMEEASAIRKALAEAKA